MRPSFGVSGHSEKVPKKEFAAEADQAPGGSHDLSELGGPLARRRTAIGASSSRFTLVPKNQVRAVLRSNASVLVRKILYAWAKAQICNRVTVTAVGLASRPVLATHDRPLRKTVGCCPSVSCR